MSADANSSQLAFYSEPAKPIMLAVCERPRNRAKAFGTVALSDVEVLALVLQGAGEEPENAIEQARKLVTRYESIPALMRATVGDLAEVGGISSALAFRVHAALEIGRRAMLGAMGEAPLLNRADIIAQYMAGHVAGLEVEKFWVLCLNRKNRLLRCVAITSGTATAALCHPREVFRAAIAEGASSIVCVHNHPSGDPAPSAPDLHATRMLREAAKAVDIDLLDHVICGRAGADPLGRGFFSFREAGLL